MRRKKDAPSSKVTPIKKPENKMSFEEQVNKFTRYHKNPDEFSKIFTELGFSYVKDGCSGNCIPCRKKASCETYSQIKECFNNPTDKPTKGEDL
jgi:hypothetical protein